MYENINGSRMNCLTNKKFIIFSVVLLSIILFFYLFSDICFPFIAGFVLAYLLAPIVEIFSKYFNRSFVSFLFLIMIVSVFIIALLIVVPKTKQYISYLMENFPTYYDNFMNFADSFFSSENAIPYRAEIDSLKSEIQKYLDQKIYIVTSILGNLLSRKNSIAGFFSFFIIMPISFYYFAKDWNKLSSKIYDIVPMRYHKLVDETFYIMRNSFRKFFHAQFYVVAILFAYYFIFLFIIGIDHYIFFGLLSGLFSFIPFIGAVIACFIVIFFSVGSLTITKLYLLIATYLIGQFIEGYVLSPKFVGKGTGLHPLWILFSFFAGFELLGVIGVLIAIPVVAMFRDLINFYLGKFKASQIYKQ